MYSDVIIIQRNNQHGADLYPRILKGGGGAEGFMKMLGDSINQ